MTLELDRNLFRITVKRQSNAVVRDPSPVMLPHPVVLRRFASHAKEAGAQRGDGPLGVRTSRESGEPFEQALLELVGVLTRNEIIRFERGPDDRSSPSEDGRNFFFPSRSDGGHRLARFE